MDGPNSEVGKVREAWRTQLGGVTDDELERVLRHLRIRDNVPLYRLKQDLAFALVLAGFAPPSEGVLDNRYVSIVRRFIQGGPQVTAAPRRAAADPVPRPAPHLRHTFATLQMAAGTNPKIVSEVLGHKEIAITLDRYSHALPTMQATAMARLDAILGRGDDAPPAAESDKGSNKGLPHPRGGKRKA